MKLLAQLSRALVRPGFVDSLRAAETPDKVAELIMGVVRPPAGVAPKKAAHAAEPGAVAAEATPAASDKPVLLAITSCPPGIAHTYMAAESLENAAADKGIEIHVETQGSGGIEP